MKYSWMAVLCLVLIACQGNTQDKVQIKTQVDSVSYSIGMDIGKTMKRQSIEVNPAVLARAIKDIMDSTKTVLTDEQAQSVMTAFQQRMMSKREETMKAEGETNLKKSEEFLAANKSKPGVVALPNGLQYKVLKEGTGKKPDSTSTVTVNYKGMLIDGKEFDSSYKRGQPATFQVNQVIPGWTQALKMMTAGSKWELYIPPALGYGERGAGATIPPNSALIFEVELISFK